jgi:hypothetical protein
MTQFGPVIEGNIFYCGNHNNVHFIEFGTFVRGNISGNIFEFDSAAPTGCVALKGTGVAAYTAIVGNTFYNSGSLTGVCIDISELDYSTIVGNVIRNWTTPITLGAATATIVENNYGYVNVAYGTSTGTGAQQTIAHGLAKVPTTVILSERTTGGALAYQSAAADATNIYVLAVNAKTYSWYARF